MANYSELIETINDQIKANGNQEITGPVLNAVLQAMVSALGEGYQFMGVATPDTNPGTPDGKVFYIATQSGTYVNFGGLILKNCLTILYFDTDWHSQEIPEANTVYVPASAGIDGINNAIWNNPGAIIQLDEGVYEGDNALTFSNMGSLTSSNTIVRGCGFKTVISRTSGADVVCRAGNNNIIEYVSLTHGIERNSQDNVFLRNCIVAGTFKDDTLVSPYNIVIASFDSDNLAKLRADFVCGESGAHTVINNAINILSNGGTIFLAGGTYNLGAYISLNSKTGIKIVGSGYSTYLNRIPSGSGFEIMGDEASVGCIVSDLRYNRVSLPDNIKQINVWNKGIFTDCIPNQLNTVCVPASAGIDGINNAIVSLLDGGTIILSEGTYTGTKPITFYKSTSPYGYASKIRIVGQGVNTKIDRTNGVFDIIANNGAISNCEVEHVNFLHRVQRVNHNPAEMLLFRSCWVEGKYVDESVLSTNIVNIGADKFYNKLSDVLELFTSNEMIIGPENRWEVHIYGHILEENEKINISKNYIDIIGHNAVVELRGGKPDYFAFIDDSSSYYGPGLNITVKNIHFLKTGCYAYRDSPCVSVESNCVTFENCVFENRTSTPMPFDQSDFSSGYEDKGGGRRHGIVISCSKYGDECKTVFKNCVGIGSDYGTISCRGWYISFGSPKLFNCIGYGGGIGEYGHGIISHRASMAELVGCTGYAGQKSYRKSAGIRYQSAGSSRLTSCTGVPSYGEKYKSNGVTVEAINRICDELEIDSSLYINEGSVNFEEVAANQQICSAINLEDLDIVPVGACSEEGYGISFWVNGGFAKLIGCKAYIGAGDNSKALSCGGKSQPDLIGCYLGVEDLMYNKDWVNDSGQNYMTFSPAGNTYAKYKVKGAILTMGFVPVQGDKIYIETVEGTPFKIVDGFDLYGYSSIALMDIESAIFNAGTQLRAYLMNNGSIKAIPGNNNRLHIVYNYAADGTSSVHVTEQSNPIIIGSLLKNIKERSAITVGELDNTELRIYDCALNGQVDDGITFKTKQYVNASSNYVIENE